MLRILFILIGKIGWQSTSNYLNLMNVVLPMNLDNDGISLMGLH